MLFFAYYLFNLKSKKNKFGFLLSTLTTLLTFSRGAFIAIFLVIIIFFLMNNPLKIAKKIWWVGIFLSFSNSMIYSVSGINMYNITIKRFSYLEVDGGSGRLDLWLKGLEFFSSNPILGIGIFNFPEYHLNYYGVRKFLHNTILEILIESGFIGFSIYLIFLILILRSFVKYNILRKSPFLFASFIGFIGLMLSLSLIINEAFILFLAIYWRYLNESYKPTKVLRVQTMEEI